MKLAAYAAVRILFVWALLFLPLRSAFPAFAQTPPPPPGPILPLDNDPLNSGLAVPPVPLPGPVGSGGSANASAFLPAASAAVDDRDNATPTLWSVIPHQAEAEITKAIANGYRLVDISIEPGSTGPLFTGVYVQNTGSFQKTEWWYVNLDQAGLAKALAGNNARLVALRAYDNGAGAIHFAAVMIANTGADTTNWWWYYNVTAVEVTAALNANHARLTQIHAYITGGQVRYAVVMVDNSGANARSWWWYVNNSVTQVATAHSANKARLVDLDFDPATGNMNVIMDACSTDCPLWWWYLNVPDSQLVTIANQYGARIISLQAVKGCGNVCYDVILLNNSNSVTTRVGEMLRNGTDGVRGLYLKQVGGQVLANLMDSTSFEPASVLKSTIHLFTIRQIENKLASLTTPISAYSPPVSGSCPGNLVTGIEPIQTADREMMWHSDNTRTRELVDHFSQAAINQMIASIGMAHTSLNHIIGCAGPIPNQTTLDDLSILYEGVARSSLINSTSRSLYFSQMAGKAQFQVETYDAVHLWDTAIPAIISTEAPTGTSILAKDLFRSQMELAYKAGNYKICTNLACSTYVDHISVFGYAQIPFCDASGPRQFVFGIYIYNATSDGTSSTTFANAKAELLREQIRAGLASCYRQTYSNQIFLPVTRQ